MSKKLVNTQLTLTVTVGIIVSTVTVSTLRNEDEPLYKRLCGKVVFDLLIHRTGLWTQFSEDEYRILIKHAVDLYEFEIGKGKLSKKAWLEKTFIAEFNLKDTL